jgi:4-alpha-glucanotransferase
MAFERSAGVLLHPTSLPGPGGIGTLGTEAYRFVDTLRVAGIQLWQVLPLGPTGYGDSPYSALSAFAGNPFLIALEPLLERGWLEPEDLAPLEGLPRTHVDFGRVVPAKMQVLGRAYERFARSGASTDDVSRFAEANSAWLEDFCLFMAAKDAHGGGSWVDWELPLRLHQQEAVELARSHLAGGIGFHRFVQYLFFEQWGALKRYANERGISIVGDIPIFVANDSSDVWANQRLFQLNDEGAQLVDAGVPPDYFSATGQLWGNPHYRWDVMESEGFAWWVERFRMLLSMVDVVRLDHFRGFAAAWAVPHGNTTAEEGAWVPAPGRALFSALHAALGDVPIIAENLGVITPDVEALRHEFGYPGMVILQFAFSTDAHDPSLPHNIERNTVVYTGTHDNDTTVGWYESATPEERAHVLRYARTFSGLDVSWDLLRAAFSSVAVFAVVPLQDVLRLGTAARMNLPGRPAGNWAWRFRVGDLTGELIASLRTMSETYGRVQAAGSHADTSS